MNNPVILPILFAVFGFLAGALVATLVFGRQGKDETPPGGYPPGLNPEQHQMVVRLWRDRKSGALLTEIGDQIHQQAATLSNVQRLQAGSALRDWGAWLGIQPAAPPPPPAAPAPPVPAPAPAQTAPPATPAPALAAQPAREAVKPPAAPVRPVSILAPGAPTVETAPEPQTMVEQIDAILQEMLESSPLKNRGIKLLEEPAGVAVWVGIERYAGVDAVPDPEIQQIVRAAVNEWETRTANDPRYKRK